MNMPDESKSDVLEKICKEYKFSENDCDKLRQLIYLNNGYLTSFQLRANFDIAWSSCFRLLDELIANNLASLAPKGRPHHALPDKIKNNNWLNKSIGTYHDKKLKKDTSGWVLPPIDLLYQRIYRADAGDVEGNAKIIQETLDSFNIDCEMIGANIGPRVTQYTVKPRKDTDMSKIVELENNIALDLSASSIRIEAPISGSDLVGIEVPNIKTAFVLLSKIFDGKEWKEFNGLLPVALGRGIDGEPVILDLAASPNIIMSGQTGSGKSIMLNSILTSLLFCKTPDNLKLILIDFKQVELAFYDDIPHLLTPVIVDPEKALSALMWAETEVDRRLKLFKSSKFKNIADHNKKNIGKELPYILIVLDEVSDLMMMAGKEAEEVINKITKYSKEAGLCMIITTSRPSTDVLTEKLKTFMPTRIAFATASSIDSKTIIDQTGAEKLLGRGDFLFKRDANDTVLRRIQGSHIGDDDIAKLTDYLRVQRPPYYDDLVTSNTVKLSGAGGIEPIEIDEDRLEYKKAVALVLKAGKVSTSLLQRKMRIGYGRAARFIQMMEDEGLVGPHEGSNPRDVYYPDTIKNKRKILFIEDDETLASVYETRFIDYGYDVKTCFDGESALKEVLKFDPDMVITGILMPKVSGFDVIDILKNTQETKRIPIIVLSALSQKSDKERAKKLGALDYIVKSEVVIADVKKIINRHMDEIYGTEYSMYENTDDDSVNYKENETIVRAVEIVIEAKKASTALLQRRMSIGYGKAARLIEILEERGYVSPSDGSRPREVLIDSIDQM